MAEGERHSRIGAHQRGGDRRARMRRRNIILALALALVAVGFYLFALFGGAV